MNDDRNEQALHQIYRSVANENVPAHIDDAVLKNAASINNRAENRGWMWPATWLAAGAMAIFLATNVSFLQTPPMEEPHSGSDAFRDAANATAEQIDGLDGIGMANPGSTNGMSANSTDHSPAPAEGTRDGQLDGDSSCPDSERVSSSRWWTCIEDLQRRGHTGAAAAELESLLTTFPNFEMPRTQDRQD